MQRAPRMERMDPNPRPDPACWHYRDARGRACGPYDTGAMARLYRFGHLRADSEVWRDADATPPAPLRSRRDAFRLHGDGRLEALPTAQPPAASTPISAPALTPAAPPPPDARPVMAVARAAPASAPGAASPAPDYPVTASGADPARRRRTWIRAAAVLLALGLTMLAARLAS